jgi:hypothetical protein
LIRGIALPFVAYLSIGFKWLTGVTSLLGLLKGSVVAGGWWLVAGGWWLVAGGWWLVAGGWWLVAGGWWLVARSIVSI